MKHNNPSHNLQNALAHALELASPQEVFFAQFQAHIITQLCTTQPLTMLDFGCGDGTLGYLISQIHPQASITGIDTHTERIEIAQGWYGQNEPRLHYSDSLEGVRTPVDVIYLANVLHHIPKNEHPALFKKLHTLLNADGKIIVLELNPYNIMQAFSFYRDPHERGNHMIRPIYVRDLLKKYGTSHTQYHKPSSENKRWWQRILHAFKPHTIYSVVLNKKGHPFKDTLSF